MSDENKTAKPTNSTAVAPKIYVDGLFLREQKFPDGGSRLKVSVLVEKFAKFVKEHKKVDGFLNFDIVAKREPTDKYTHYGVLDTWQKPNSDTKPVVKSVAKPVTKAKETEPVADEEGVF